MILAVTNIVKQPCKYSDNRVVEVGLSVTRTNIVISVKDQSWSIPEDELLQHVFEPCFHTTDYNGYGVGLPLSLNIIRLQEYCY
ncbi:hypothetical protein CS542_05040 [Pedobacter sp. IW39]|nr:hypothetical protein CS542_05040 [Pedobacter sp. IW39]